MKYHSRSLVLALALAFFSAPASFAQTHFANCTSRTADNATIIIPESVHASIQGAPIESGDEIAVLTTDGSCAGVVVWNGISTALAAWGADEYSQLGGYHTGDAIRFAVWDASAQVEHRAVEVSYAASSAFVRSDGLYANGAIFELSSLTVAADPAPVNPGVPTLRSPAHGATGITTSPVLEWDGVNSAISYDVELSVTADFSSSVTSFTGLTGTSHKVESLSEGTAYYWRVRAVTEHGTSDYASARRFTTHTSHTLVLQQGWNLISSYVAPSSPDMEGVFGPVSEHLVIAKNGEGKVFWPEYGINDIGTWTSTHAYKVLVEAPATIQLTGVAAVPESTPIALQQGWNTVAYLRNSEMPVSQAVASASAHLVLLKDNAGNIYFPELGIDDIGVLRPGEGYSLFVREAVTLTYPANDAAAASKATTSTRNMTASKRGVGYSAHVIARSIPLPDGEYLTVWSGARQVGSGVVSDSVAVLLIAGEDPLTEHVDGAAIGEPLVLRRGLAQSGTELKLEGTRDVLTGEQGARLVYQHDAVWEVSATTSSLAGPATGLEFGLEQNYPNPFSSSTTIRYALDEEARVELALFNTLGQRVRVLASVSQPAGEHEVRLDAHDLPSGAYFYRLTAGGRVETRTMVLAK